MSDRAEIAAALRKAAQLSPSTAGDAYVEYLVRNHDTEAADELTDAELVRLSATGLLVLAKFVKYSQPQRHEALLRRAVALGRDARGADEAVAALLGSLDAAADGAEVDRLLADVAARGAYRAGRVSDALESDYHGALARRLRAAVDASAAPAADDASAESS